MDHPQRSALRQPNGDLLVPAQTAELLEQLLHRIRLDLDTLQGRSCAVPGQMETGNQLTQRQDYVDQLASSVGVIPPEVTGRVMPDASYRVDSTELLAQVQALSGLLFTRP